MSEIVSIDKLFNQEYLSSKNREISFNELLNFCVFKNYLSDEKADEITSAYQDAVMNYVLSNFEYDEEEDSTAQIKSEGIKIVKSVDDYLKELNDPYKSVKMLVETNPLEVIKNASTYFATTELQVKVTYQKIVESSKVLYDYFEEYKKFLDFLGRRIQDRNAVNISMYPLTSGLNTAHIESISELNQILQDLLIEMSILNHFSTAELVRLCQSLKYYDIWKNILVTAITNYIVNYLYKGDISILISSDVKKLAKDEIEREHISEIDYYEAMENPDLNLSYDEKDYLETYFKPDFMYELLETKKTADYLVVTKSRKRK